MWSEGRIGSYSYEVKYYDEPSRFGIDGGRISKLFIRDLKLQVVCSYDRGWDVKPQNEEAIDVFAQLLKLYN